MGFTPRRFCTGTCDNEEAFHNIIGSLLLERLSLAFTISFTDLKTGTRKYKNQILSSYLYFLYYWRKHVGHCFMGS